MDIVENGGKWAVFKISDVQMVLTTLHLQF